MTYEDFQQLLEVLTVEQHMGMTMERQSDIPFDATLQAGRYGKEFLRARLSQEDDGELRFTVLENSFSDEPLLAERVAYQLTPLQAEDVAELFGCSPQIDFESAESIWKLRGNENVQAWLQVFTTVLANPKYEVYGKAKRNKTVELVYKTLLNRQANGWMKSTNPAKIWFMVQEHLHRS